jgi:DNA polymerase II
MANMTYRGFILQATYRIHHGVPVVYLFGRLDDGRTFVVKDNQQRPHFFVPSADAQKVRNATVKASDFVGLTGESLARVEVQVPSDAPAVRDALHAQNARTFEADVRFAVRFLIDRNIKGGVAITGKAQPGRGSDLVFANPQLTPADVSIEPKVLSFDIETNPNTDQLLAIACYGCGVDEVVVVDGSGRDMPPNAIGVRTQKQALAWFAALVQRLDVDVLTGWNVIDFDLSFLARVAAKEHYDLQLGRERGALRIRAAEGYFGSGSANIPGRLVLDGIDLLRGAFIKLDDYSLDAVAQEVLGEGKTLGGENRDKVAEILSTYADDLPAFTTYARTDARLALQILHRLQVIELAFARSALAGMTPDRVAASIASFDFLYLSALRQQKIAAPTVLPGAKSSGPQSGGAVFEPVVGIHKNVWVCDFKSLYPSIIRTFNIDPLGHLLAQSQSAPHQPAMHDDVIRTYDGTPFTRRPSILPGMLDTLFPQRAQAKARGDDIASQAIKILMNSFYGVLGTPACRFYNPALANAITSQGRYLLGWSKQWFEERGYKVLYGDTDSVFVASGIADPEVAQTTAAELISGFNRDLTQHLFATAGVASKLELEFEKLYTQLFLASVRGGSQGARKRYAGLRMGAQDIEFVGMEVVRRDWTPLAKKVQRNLFARLFKGEEVAAYLSAEVKALRSGKLDELLVYRKGLRKALSSYTANVPPHVQAVKKAQAQSAAQHKPPPPAPRVVAYVMTTAGPELVSEMQHTLDREYYVERQVRPVAEPVLEALGLDFNQVIGDDRQIALF